MTALSASTALQPRPMEYCLLEVHSGARTAEVAGVILLDREADRIHLQLREDWDSFSSDDAEVLSRLEDHLRDDARRRGGSEALRHLERLQGSFVSVTARERTIAVDPAARLRRLYRENVKDPRALPVLNLRAAAGYLSDEAVFPEGVYERFAATVGGKSMEPTIPDGSECEFRRIGAGSREGKRVLVCRLGLTGDTGQLTVKVYRSEKIYHPDGTWEHGKIRMIPLNPEFEEWLLSPDEFVVLGEFVRVLPPEE